MAKKTKREQDPQITEDNVESSPESPAEVSVDVTVNADDEDNNETQHENDSTASDILILQVQLAEAQQSLADAKEQALRAAAEVDNVRRRMHREIDKAEKFSIKSLADALLPALDAFDSALQSEESEDSESTILEGVKLSVKVLLDALRKHGIEPFDPHGEVFDPEKHKAMTYAPNPDVEPGTVIEVIRKGYLIHERLLRAAEVVVAQ